MVSILKSACIILSVFLSLGFSSAHRFLLDQANDHHKNTDPVNHEAVTNSNGEEVGGGDGTGSGSGSGSSTVYGSGIRTGKGYETNGHRSRVGKGVGNCGSGHGSGPGVGVGVGSGPGCLGHGIGKGEGYGSGSGCAPVCVPCFTAPIPRIPRPPMPTIPTPRRPLPTLPVCPPRSLPGHCDPCNNNGPGNCQPEPYHGGSATGDAKVVQQANYTLSEPYPALDHSQP